MIKEVEIDIDFVRRWLRNEDIKALREKYGYTMGHTYRRLSRQRPPIYDDFMKDAIEKALERSQVFIALHEKISIATEKINSYE